MKTIIQAVKLEEFIMRIHARLSCCRQKFEGELWWNMLSLYLQDLKFEVGKPANLTILANQKI